MQPARAAKGPETARVLAALALPCVLALLASLAACSAPAPRRDVGPLPLGSGALSRERVRALRGRESALRSAWSPRKQPVWLDASGADPYRIAPLAKGSGFVGLLRGRQALVTLSPELVELRRVPLPETPTALCVGSDNQAWVASRYGHRLVRVSLGSDGGAPTTLERELPLAGVADVACGQDGVVYVLPADGSALLTLDAAGHELGRYAALPGGLRLQRHGRFLLETSLFERALRVLSLGPRGVPTSELGRVVHDGTLWAMAAGERRESGLLVALAGVEDKPLVRAHGEFENIDSFVWIYELGERGFVKLAELDVSDFGAIVPKALHLRFGDQGATLDIVAAGSDRLLHVSWSRSWQGPARVSSEPAPPGVSDAVFGDGGSVIYADPLFDAWVKLDRYGQHLTRVDPERRAEPDVRLGEALFFTGLMAPDNQSLGTHSRFSCETCHFEGGVDGRKHYTGRAEVSVVTKSLFGLANNRPHFSRAMDPDLASVCHNEFRVAGAGSGKDPWFGLESARFSWLHDLGIARAQLGPLELREALLRFLYAFTPPPNPYSQGRAHFSSTEAQGARAFRDHCQSCHAARLLSDDSASEVPFADWERSIFSRTAPLVWARGEYAKAGILPYVHERGTRITSLRRLLLKPRYFSNGSAPDLANVLERFREGPDGAVHDAAGDARGAALPSEERRALAAFLRLL